MWVLDFDLRNPKFDPRTFMTLCGMADCITFDAALKRFHVANVENLLSTILHAQCLTGSDWLSCAGMACTLNMDNQKPLTRCAASFRELEVAPEFLTCANEQSGGYKTRLGLL